MPWKKKARGRKKKRDARRHKKKKASEVKVLGLRKKTREGKGRKFDDEGLRFWPP